MNEKFHLVRIDGALTDLKKIGLIDAQSKTLAGRLHAGSLPKDISERIRGLHDPYKIIILNENVLEMVPTYKHLSGRTYPFCSLHKNGGGVTVLSTQEALVSGNYFLCIEQIAEITESEPRQHAGSPYANTHVDNGHSIITEYTVHTSVEEALKWRNNPPYVNMDRSSDSIGYSSWDGNLVDWFRASFTARTQYALHSGLFPKE